MLNRSKYENTLVSRLRMTNIQHAGDYSGFEYDPDRFEIFTSKWIQINGRTRKQFMMHSSSITSDQTVEIMTLNDLMDDQADSAHENLPLAGDSIARYCNDREVNPGTEAYML